MKKLLILLGILMVTNAPAQSADMEQLILDLQKLSELKSILKDMQQGYEIIAKGYTVVSDITKGNFNLHEIFLDGLLSVSPAVKNYSKVASIISDETQLISEYKSAYNHFNTVGIFKTGELDYIAKVYQQLVGESLKNLDALLMVVTASNLRMNDAERLASIDQIHGSMQDQLQFLRHFNNSTSMLLIQRSKASNDAAAMQHLYGVK
jgi:hypothetical protein